MKIGLYDTFHGFLSPFVLEIGKLVFECTLIGGSYVVSRCNSAEGLKRIKYGTIGYAMLRFISLYMEYSDKVIEKAIESFKIGE